MAVSSYPSPTFLYLSLFIVPSTLFPVTPSSNVYVTYLPLFLFQTHKTLLFLPHRSLYCLFMVIFFRSFNPSNLYAQIYFSKPKSSLFFCHTQQLTFFKPMLFSCAGIFKQSMGARYRVGIRLSYHYRTARLHSLVELVSLESIPGLLKSLKIQSLFNLQSY